MRTKDNTGRSYRRSYLQLVVLQSDICIWSFRDQNPCPFISRTTLQGEASKRAVLLSCCKVPTCQWHSWFLMVQGPWTPSTNDIWRSRSITSCRFRQGQLGNGLRGFGLSSVWGGVRNWDLVRQRCHSGFEIFWHFIWITWIFQSSLSTFHGRSPFRRTAQTWEVSH